MRPVLVSVAVHVAILLALIAHRADPPPAGPATTTVAAAEPAPPDVELVVDVVRDGGGGGGGMRASTPAPSARRRAPPGDAWQQVTIRVESATGGASDGGGAGDGGGIGTGHGTGIGAGIRDVVRLADEVPAPPPPPPPAKISKARPAKLIFPSRNRDVEDEADLFVARVTVDRDGDVVGAHMVRTRPGSRGDQAANAIWAFRYLPALDDDGRAIASTFEQPFQIAH